MPVPKIVRARPVATWLAIRLSVRTAKISEASAPANIAASAPSAGTPVVYPHRETGDRADQHHALDAEIEDAGLFDHQLAERGDEERRRRTGDRHQDR